MESGAHGSFPFALSPLANAIYNHGVELVYLPIVAIIGVVGVLAWWSGRRGHETADHDSAA